MPIVAFIIVSIMFILLLIAFKFMFSITYIEIEVFESVLHYLGNIKFKIFINTIAEKNKILFLQDNSYFNRLLTAANNYNNAIYNVYIKLYDGRWKNHCILIRDRRDGRYFLYLNDDLTNNIEYIYINNDILNKKIENYIKNYKHSI